MYHRWSSSKPSPCALRGNSGVLVHEHRADGVGLQDPGRSVAPAVEQGAGQHRQVVRRGEQPGVPGDAAEGPGVLVVHLAADHLPAGPRLRLGRRDPVHQRGRWVEHGVGHPQRAGDAVGDHLVERLPGDLLHDQPERDQAEVGVDVGRSGLRPRLHGEHRGQPLLDGRVGAVEREPGRQPADVRQQVPDGHVLLAVLGEGRQVRRHRLVQRDPAGLDLLHHDQRRERLRDRGQVEDRVAPHLHLLLGGQLGVRVGVPQRLAGRVVDRHHPVPRGQDHAAGVHRVRRRGLEEGAQVLRHPGQGLGEQPRLLGAALPQPVVREREVVGSHLRGVRREAGRLVALLRPPAGSRAGCGRCRGRREQSDRQHVHHSGAPHHGRPA